MAKSAEIRHNKELLHVEALRQHVRLDFGELAVDLLAHIEIIAPDGRVDGIDNVWEFQGNLNALWPLIGQRMTNIVMDEDSFRLTFENGTLIRAKNRKAYDFVVVWEPESRTGYPTVLLYLSKEQ